MKGNKYQDTVKVEFRDLIENLVMSNRKSFHLYTVQRILSLGLLIDFRFNYIKLGNPEQVGIELRIPGYGPVIFVVDVDSSYCTITEQDKDLLKKFIEKFDVEMKALPDGKHIF